MALDDFQLDAADADRVLALADPSLRSATITRLGGYVLVLSRLEGAHVWSLLDRLSDAELAGVNRQIGAVLRSLHEVGFERFGYVGTGHDDCHDGNVLGGWRVSSLLDFENAVAGDPLLDLAKAHCYSPRRSEALLAALVAGYGALRPDWREALGLYVLYHWLELWDWLASLGRAEALAGIAEEMRDLTARP